MLAPNEATGPEAGHGPRRMSRRSTPHGVDGQDSPAASDGPHRADRKPARGGPLWLLMLVTLILVAVAMLVAMASTFTLR